MDSNRAWLRYFGSPELRCCGGQGRFQITRWQLPGALSNCVLIVAMGAAE
jgi:hypothetical protein